MKKTILCILVIASLSVKGQTAGELFRQKATQKEYLIQQIAALQIYIGKAKKGYQVVDQGLKSIGSISGRAYDADKKYFSALKNVNPLIRKNPKIKEILQLQKSTLLVCKHSYQELEQGKMYTGEELKFLQQVYNKLIRDGENRLQELDQLMTDQVMEMKDDERMLRIDQIYRQMKDIYLFTISFSQDARAVAAARKRELKDVRNGRILYGITP